MQSIQPGGVPEAEILIAAGLAVTVTLFIMAVLRVELDLPFLVGVLVVPVVVAIGFLLALAFRVWLEVSMLQAGGLLGGLLAVLVVAYEALRMFVSEPPPPTARY